MSDPKPVRLNVEFWEEGGRWWFHAPMVTGGGCKTLRSAFRHAVDAIEFHAAAKAKGTGGRSPIYPSRTPPYGAAHPPKSA